MPTRAKKTAPRRGRPADQAAMRGQILGGAADAFARRGYAATTVEDILQAAGVSRQTFYRFFKNKDEACQAVFEAARAVFLTTIEAAAARGETPMEKLAYGIEAFLDFPVVAGPIYRVLQAESLQPDSPFARFRRDIYDALIGLFDREVRKILDQEIDPLVYRGLIAAIEEISNHAMAEAGPNARWRRRAREATMLIMEAMVARALATEADTAPTKS